MIAAWGRGWFHQAKTTGTSTAGSTWLKQRVEAVARSRPFMTYLVAASAERLLHTSAVPGSAAQHLDQRVEVGAVRAIAAVRRDAFADPFL